MSSDLATTLTYVATAGQTAFGLSVNDRFGNTFILSAANLVEVTVGGARLAMDDGTGFGGYRINVPLNSVILLYPAGVGSPVIIDVFGGVGAPAYFELATTLTYVATAGQVVFSLGSNDRFGNKFLLVSGYLVDVTVNGVRLALDDGTGFGGYRINVPLNNISLLYPAGSGSAVIIDVFSPATPGPGPGPTPTPTPTPTQPVNTSATYNFFPSLGECTLNALSRVQIRGPMVFAEHLHQAWMEANLMQVEWSNRGPNLWKVSEEVFDTVSGQATYPIPSTAIMVLNVTVGMGNPPNEQELTITPMTRQEYTMQPNKAIQARPTSFWYDRALAPTITFWPTPDQVYHIHVWSYGQQMDAVQRAAMQLEVPYRWLDAACAGLAARLAVHYAPALEMQRKSQSDSAYQIAATQDTEAGSIYFLPMVETYFD